MSSLVLPKKKIMSIKNREEQCTKDATSHENEIKKLDSRLVEQAVEIKDSKKLRLAVKRK